MSPAAAFLLFAFLFLLLLLLLAFRFGRSRRPDEPPLDKGVIPWLGHALEFGKDAAKFLSEMKKKHGDIFTVQAAGKFITILLDPHSYDVVLWESRSKLDFNKYARVLMDRMFDVRLPDYDPNEEKTMLRMTLQNQNLSSLTKAMAFNLQTVLLSDPSRASQQWEEEGLFHLSYSTMLRAGYLTLYGNAGKDYEDVSHQAKDQAHSLEVYNQFYKLDRLLMKAARSSLSAEEKKKFDSVKKDLWKLLSVKRLDGRANQSVWLDCYKQHLVNLGVDEDMQTRAMLLQLWSTQSNAGPAVFWLLLFLLKHPSAMAAVQGEMEKILGSRKHTTGHVCGISQEKLDSTPIFATVLARTSGFTDNSVPTSTSQDSQQEGIMSCNRSGGPKVSHPLNEGVQSDSVMNETLRLTAAPFITREVLRDMCLRLPDCREYCLRKGDRLCLFPYISPQMDPEIYEEPEKFKYNRFLNADGTEKTDFYKGGEKLKYYTMPWGAGINVCIGKFFAVNSIKQCVFLLLRYFDLELKDAKIKIPDFDKERYGFGMLQPEMDVIVRYKLKDQ